MEEYSEPSNAVDAEGEKSKVHCGLLLLGKITLTGRTKAARSFLEQAKCVGRLNPDTACQDYFDRYGYQNFDTL